MQPAFPLLPGLVEVGAGCGTRHHLLLLFYCKNEETGIEQLDSFKLLDVEQEGMGYF